VEALLAPYHRLAADGYDLARQSPRNDGQENKASGQAA
jgi:hypothetical protein